MKEFRIIIENYEKGGEFAINFRQLNNPLFSLFFLILLAFGFSGNDVKAAEGDWTASFYPNMTRSGTPITKTYSNLDFSWGYGSPDSRIPSDYFSAKISKRVSVSEPGNYRISGVADDGIRIYVDGVRRFDYYTDGVHRFNNEFYLSQGTHVVTILYYERKWSASLQVDLERVQEHISSDNWNVSFYPNFSLSGTPITQSVGDLNYYWGHGSPNPYIPTDYFTAKASKRVSVREPGKYRIKGLVDDGARIYVDGKRRFDYWTDGLHRFNNEIYFTEGTHVITILYYERKWSAALDVDVEKVEEQPPTDSWKATYYPTVNFVGTPVVRSANELDFYWGSGSPAAGIPTDNFSAVFERKLVLDSPRTFKLSGLADDGIRVYIDGIRQLNLWADGVNRFNKDISLTAGTHIVKVEYYDHKWSAAIDLDLQDITPVNVPPGYWKATLYPSADLTGTPVNAAYQDLNFYWGSGSPHVNIPSDNFSGVFEKTITVSQSGNYRFVGKADDGVRVYVDGVKKIDLWRDGVQTINTPIPLSAGNHQVRVEYYDRKYSAALDLQLIEDFWNAKFYPNSSLSGTPVNLAYNELNLAWGAGSPHTSIPVDEFSGVLEKQVFIDKAGKYSLTGKADDGIRIYVDGVKQLDLWKDGVNEFNHNINLSQGLHTIKVEYYDRKYSATLVMDLKEVTIRKVTTYTQYDVTYTDALNRQIGVSQTDKRYDAYVRSDALIVDAATPNAGTVNGAGWNVRGVPVDGWVLGKLNDKEKVTIYSKAKQSDGWDWYKIYYNRTWVNPSPTDISYYLNPNTFALGSSQSYQFIKLSQPADSDPTEVNQKVLTNKGVLSGKASVFLQAGRSYSVNEIYLISHALHETGNGTSRLATGVKVNQKRDANGNVMIDPATGEKEIVVLDPSATSYEAIVYNMYGIGAFDRCPLECGSRKAFNEGWTTVDKAIVGGAQFVAEKYVHVGQDTLYKMKFNPANPGTHQYATDIGWAVKQTPRIYNIYSMLESYSLIFDVPRYR